MTRLRVDLDRLDDFVRHAQRVAAQLDRVRGEVDTRVRDAQVVWTGRAAAAQVEAHARWAAGAAELHAALESLRVMAATAHGNYAAAVHANRRMWSV
jgi:WXG100 family type VII secretion target